ncbi:hypothetical protein [Flavobacterium wongokense]|uniref:hypothetical protein n=1 Tax=Flavobacterium wongokense TaxID=2910674 RepID=UPI001F26AA62|nr:hypothetical protein [Flavobacterium sp. WG47]MCF6131618.1 hypothetical protein [Flavobacterium sp. WG47]
MKDRNSNSHHILNTSANLLGLCFIVLTSRNILQMKAASLIDEFTAFAIFSFMFSCILSFMSMRSKTELGLKYEKFADILFFIGLFSLFVTAVLITFNIID